MTDPDDARRFSAMYEQNRSRVYAYAVSKAGRQLADEIVSEVFLVAWRRIADVPDPPLPWLLVAARNVAASQFRTAVREQSIAAEMRSWRSQAQFAEGDIAEQVAERITVLTALATLPEPDRELLIAVAWHGLSARSAAQVVGCSTAAYFVRLHRARRRLELAVAAVITDPRDAGGADGNGERAAPGELTGDGATPREPTGDRAAPGEPRPQSTTSIPGQERLQ
jgi:RNA polymerase sigma-70 factor (ECF subfamily)